MSGIKEELKGQSLRCLPFIVGGSLTRFQLSASYHYFKIDIKQVSSYNISVKEFKWEFIDRNGKEFQKLLS